MKKSAYPNQTDLDWLQDWTRRILENSGLTFNIADVPTAYGKTHVYTYLANRTDLPAVMIVPGMRTSGLYWVINNNLAVFKEKFRLFILDNIGQPGWSEGTNPNIKNGEYGQWLNEVSDQLKVKKAFWLGASFGCQLIVKLSQVAPDKIEKACFICPGGIVQIGMTRKNLSANMFLIWFKSKRSNQKFIDRVVYGPGFKLAGKPHELLSEAILETVKRFKMKTGYPYPMKKEEFAQLKMPVLILPGADDPMFAPERLLPRIREVFPVQPAFEPLPGHGHGSELSPLATEKAFGFFS